MKTKFTFYILIRNNFFGQMAATFMNGENRNFWKILVHKRALPIFTEKHREFPRVLALFHVNAGYIYIFAIILQSLALFCVLLHGFVFRGHSSITSAYFCPFWIPPSPLISKNQYLIGSPLPPNHPKSDFSEPPPSPRRVM